MPAKKVTSMIKGQRKYHFMIWLLAGILLPAGFVSAILLRPPLPEYLPAKEDRIMAGLSPLSDSTSLLHITVGQPLTTPSCLVYYRFNDQEILAGKVDQMGTYSFVVGRFTPPVTITFYDAIHKETITRLTLTKTGEP